MKRILALASIALAAGCGGKKAGGASDADVAGVWQFASGQIFQHPGSYPQNLDIGWLELRPDGTGTVYGTLGSIHGCGAAIFSVINDTTIAIDTPEIEGSHLYRWAKPDAGTLALIDELGNSSTFARADAVPTSAQCTAATVAASFPVPSTPGYQSGLAYDQTSLYFRDGDKPGMAAVSPTGAAVASYPISSQWRNPQAFQSGGFWMGCACGGDDSLQLRSAADTQLDVLNMSSLGIQGSFHGVAALTGSQIEVSATVTTGSGFTLNLLRVDATGTGTVMSNVKTDTYFSSLAIDGSGNLWGIGGAFGPILVQIDMTTGVAQRQLELPPDADWRGMAFAGGSLYLIGYPIADPSQPGVLTRIDSL